MTIFLFVGAASAGALADEPAFGDLGKPDDYEQTIKRFRDEMPDFDAYVDQVLPTAFDFRDYGMVTPAKDQGACGSCWAFASVGALESKILMMGRSLYDISEQQQVSCNDAMAGCLGGSMTALQFWYDRGAMLESCTGYPSSGGTVPACSNYNSCSRLPYHTMNYYTVDTSDVNEIKASCYYDGPTYFRFNVYSDFKDDAGNFWYNAAPGDVYVNNVSSSYTGQGHAVLIIGWSDTKSAWLLKNSWGATGGPNGDGTFWMAYSGHAHDLSFGMANVEINYANAEVLHKDGAIYDAADGWNLATPPNYPGSAYAVDKETRGDGSYTVLHRDGALWDSDAGWTMTTPPYYPGTAYARDLELFDSSYAILHKDGAIYRSDTGWIMTTPPYYAGSNYAVDLELDDVLWDQVSTANTAYTMANQDFETAYDTHDLYTADDFSTTSEQTITSIYVPGNTWNPGTSLTNATSLNWAIYANTGGLPAGYPGGGSAPVWSLSVAPTNPQVVLSTGSGGYATNVTLNPSTPITLPAGTYWLIFYAELNYGSYGQAGIHPSSSTNGYEAKVINPGGGWGQGTTWVDVTTFHSTSGLTDQDIAFRLDTMPNQMVLHQDGALWSSNSGWTMTTPPYYPGSAYARDMENFYSSYAILHKDGAIWDSDAGWSMTTPPYYPGTAYAVDLELREEAGDYDILHKDGGVYDSVDGWYTDKPPHYSGSDYARDLEVE